MNLQGATRGGWQERRLAGALAASLALHALVLLPASWARLAPFAAQRLDVSLRPAQVVVVSPPVAAPVVGAAPAAVASEARRRPAPPAAASTPGAPQRAAPRVVAADAVRRIAAPPAIEPQTPATASVERASSPVAVAAMATSPAAPGRAAEIDPAPDPAAVARYRFAVARAVVKRYPPLAIERGLEGVARVRLAMAGAAMPPRVTVEATSGHVLLDEEAKEMIRRAASRAAIPEPLRGRSFAIDLPVRFDLADAPDG